MEVIYTRQPTYNRVQLNKKTYFSGIYYSEYVFQSSDLNHSLPSFSDGFDDSICIHSSSNNFRKVTFSFVFSTF